MANAVNGERTRNGREEKTVMVPIFVSFNGDAAIFIQMQGRPLVKVFSVHVFFYKHTLFSAQPGVANREAVFQPQGCLDVCLTNQRIFVYEMANKVV